VVIMSVWTRRRISVGLATLLLAGCGASHPGAGHPSSATGRLSASATSSAPSSAPSSSAASATALRGWPCLAGSEARGVTVAASPPLPIAILGSARRVVVLSDESDEDLCSWLPFARVLRAAGDEVVLYDYTGTATDDLTAAVGYLRLHGARSVGLVGASEGAKTSIIVSARLSHRPDALVSLSAEPALQGTLVAPYAARLHAPTLFVTAATDPYGATDATREFYRKSPATTKKLLVVAGTQHGTALLSDASVRAPVLAFLAAHVG
jgi:hypothetical protein